ncbi:diguanylate cyclase domain-containing protein [Paracoccus sp. (in: a-proteobacteria)]|uniref:diguanylate cyclase domain-containing protein n=1 Tax=Paracoccus sp. TaxID=267 RepID=UPI00396C7DBE
MTARILVADGISTARVMVKARLSAVCYDVVAVGTAQELHQQLQLARPDLIILGHDVADGSSMALCARLAGDPDHAGIPILMMVNASARLEALEAGATAILDPRVETQMLMARVRGLLRDVAQPQDTGMGLAEEATPFHHDRRPLVALVADTMGRAVCWRQSLEHRMNCRFEIRDPDTALGSATAGRTADLYVISADIRGKGDGLRLMSELRSRQGSRDAGFVVALAPERGDLSPMALDLGAGDVMSDTLATPEDAQAAAMSLQTLLSRKSQSDQRRAEIQRHMLWSMTDPLTGLYNRRYALPKLDDIAQDALGAGQSFAVFAIDLDHFKAINDCHGHSAGDMVLAEVAQRLRSALGSEGMVARMGGEEFLAVLFRCTDAMARKTAETLRKSIEARPVALGSMPGGQSLSVTASVGAALVTPSRGCTEIEQVTRAALERADQALLAAKVAGRNCVMCSPSNQAA